VGLSKVSIELDCKQVVDDKVRRFNINFMFGAIIDIWKTSIKINQNFKISYIMRQANSIVHLLARVHYLMLAFIFIIICHFVLKLLWSKKY